MTHSNTLARLGVLALCCVITGCTTSVPPLAARQAADYGPAPTAYEAIIGAALKAHLQDPASLTMQVVRGPVKAWWPVRGPGQYGYGVCVWVKAQKKSGGSRVPEFYYFHLSHDAVVAMVAPKLYLPERGAEACRTMQERSVTLQPPP